ncbi:MAG: Omp28-related outer membrane protein [Saprospiraceae bacterium]|nr:Omp28-related outer membrane protein [Saprospiraceae bacterium]MBP7699379.1 Omp28-related outer membrane protein [Saprospiraceae bacterium]
MKNYINAALFSFAILSLLTLFSCEEIAPTIPPLGPKETGDRKVIVEEFTGVKCVNCPNGSAQLENLIAGVYGENLIVVSIHAGEYSDPYSDSRYDFRTPEGTYLLGYFGEPLGYPTAVINRQVFPPSTQFQNSQSAQWTNHIKSVLDVAPSLSLNIENVLDGTSRNLTVKSTIVPTEDINGEVRLTVMLTETNILDKQLTPTGLNIDYSHKHVLRKVLTNFDGNAITETLRAGVPIEKSYAFTLPEAWNIENCKIVAFVHRATATDKHILQAEEKSLTE